MSVVPPRDRLCLDLALSAWEAGDLGHVADLSNAAVSMALAAHWISSLPLLSPDLVVGPTP